MSSSHPSVQFRVIICMLCVRRICLFFYLSIDPITCKHEALQGARIIFGFTSFPSSFEGLQARQLVDGIYPEWCKIKHE